jgi:hypothetical protein
VKKIYERLGIMPGCMSYQALCHDVRATRHCAEMFELLGIVPDVCLVCSTWHYDGIYELLVDSMTRYAYVMLGSVELLGMCQDV